MTNVTKMRSNSCKATAAMDWINPLCFIVSKRNSSPILQKMYQWLTGNPNEEIVLKEKINPPLNNVSNWIINPNGLRVSFFRLNTKIEIVPYYQRNP